MRYPDISPDVFRPALLKEMRCFMLILPILALIANSLALHIRCSTPGSKAFKTFVALLVMVVNSFANLFLIMSRILGLYDDVIVSLTVLFIFISFWKFILKIQKGSHPGYWHRSDGIMAQKVIEGDNDTCQHLSLRWLKIRTIHFDFLFTAKYWSRVFFAEVANFFKLKIVEMAQNRRKLNWRKNRSCNMSHIIWLLLFWQYCMILLVEFAALNTKESLLWTVTLVIDTTETCCSIVFWTISVYTIWCIEPSTGRHNLFRDTRTSAGPGTQKYDKPQIGPAPKNFDKFRTNSIHGSLTFLPSVSQHQAPWDLSSICLLAQWPPVPSPKWAPEVEHRPKAT